MSIRYGCTVLAAALLSSTAAFAQYQPAATTGQLGIDNTPVTLVGCLQRESDYRRQHDRGQGGFLGTGGGMGDEFILINAMRIDAPGTPVPNVDCAVETTGEAYELTGEREDDLKGYAGQRIEVSGFIKKAETEIGTNGELRPTGGYLMDGGDLRLWEVHVDSFTQPTIAQVRTERREEQIVSQVQPQPMMPSEAVGTTGQVPAPVAEVRELPRTASPLPFAGLAALMLLGGAWGVHALRRSL
jgi:hypothetical protein